MTLKNSFKLLSKYKGSSKFAFWSSLNVGDVVAISIELKGQGKGYGDRILQPKPVISKEGSTESFSCRFTSFCKYLEQLELEPCEVNS